MPVSYTHLDVYKRQSKYRFTNGNKKLYWREREREKGYNNIFPISARVQILSTSSTQRVINIDIF